MLFDSRASKYGEDALASLAPTVKIPPSWEISAKEDSSDCITPASLDEVSAESISMILRLARQRMPNSSRAPCFESELFQHMDSGVIVRVMCCVRLEM